jgi:AraC-like DNA-binding protein
MKVANVRLMQGVDASFIYYVEKAVFTTWHCHPEFELCLITKGGGKRMVGDNIDIFEENDLVLIGPDTPHEYICDPQYFDQSGNFYGEGIVIQFVADFLGDTFFSIPEHQRLHEFIFKSGRGYAFQGESKEKIVSIMMKMQQMNNSERLYSLFSIFKIFMNTNEYRFLSSPVFSQPFGQHEAVPMQKALQYIMQNYRKDISIKDLLAYTNMSNTAFYTAFKNAYRMTFKEYLLSIRVGYACRLLTYPTQKISQIAYESGFENISNFNRQFKRIKGITPSDFLMQIKNIEMKNITE